MKKILVVFFMMLAFVSCKKEPKQSVEKEIKIEKEIKKEAEWASLFDGKTLDGWHVYNGGDINSHWAVEDGAMVFDGSGDEIEYNIVTDKEYTDFKLSIEWKISEGGNSGIMWGVNEDAKYGHPYDSGPEIQVLDDEKHGDGKYPNHKAGSLYDMITPPDNVAKPVGEWNVCEILINHKTNEGKVWLNGTLTAEFPVQGEKWDSMVENSKFKGWEAFGKYSTGKICLQDHGNIVSFRNIKIQEL